MRNVNNKIAFVTGAAGQDGSFLCELLLSKPEYDKVYGLIRPSGDSRISRLDKCVLDPKFELVFGDILDPQLPWQVKALNPDEVYLLAAQTQVMQSYHTPSLAMETNATATARFLQTLYPSDVRTYFAATSEMFGTMPFGTKAREDYPLAAQSPYAAAKVASHLLCRLYREKGSFVTSGIAFNHESNRRGENFVTRKVGLGVRRFLKYGTPVTLGNINARRDWHHASDTVRGMWLSLQHDEPGEYVFASGFPRSVGDLVEDVCRHLGADASKAIRIEESEKRPWDVDYLCGDASKALSVLGWAPGISWGALIEDVCRVD